MTKVYEVYDDMTKVYEVYKVGPKLTQRSEDYKVGPKFTESNFEMNSIRCNQHGDVMTSLNDTYVQLRVVRDLDPTVGQDTPAKEDLLENRTQKLKLKGINYTVTLTPLLDRILPPRKISWKTERKN
jgi:hypothetical protein